MPHKLFEFIAVSKTIVATAASQTAEMIRDGQYGLLVEAGDVVGFAEAISRIGA